MIVRAALVAAVMLLPTEALAPDTKRVLVPLTVLKKTNYDIKQ